MEGDLVYLRCKGPCACSPPARASALWTVKKSVEGGDIYKPRASEDHDSDRWLLGSTCLPFSRGCMVVAQKGSVIQEMACWSAKGTEWTPRHRIGGSWYQVLFSLCIK